jgi:hypothetical protein
VKEEEGVKEAAAVKEEDVIEKANLVWLVTWYILFHFKFKFVWLVYLFLIWWLFLIFCQC